MKKDIGKKDADCEAEEIAWINAEAVLFIVKGRLERAEAEVEQSEQEIQNIDNEIEQKQNEFEELKNKIRGSSTVAGVVIGGGVGAFTTRTFSGMTVGARKGASMGG